MHTKGRPKHFTKVYLPRHVKIVSKKPIHSIKGQETKHIKTYIRGTDVFAVPKRNTKLVYG